MQGPQTLPDLTVALTLTSLALSRPAPTPILFKESHMPPHQELILDFEQALQLVQASAHPLPSSENVPLLDSLHRVLAQDILADRDQPPFHRSTRDGYAVRAADLLAGPLTIAGQLRAGSVWTDPLAPHTAIQIMTGAPIPPDADAVVMVEHIIRQENQITLTAGRTLSPNENIVPRASEARQGQIIAPRGTRITPAEIASAASCGYATLEVTRRPTVAIVATGDELVELTQTPAPQQIRNSNSYALAAMVTAAGGQPHRLPTAPDVREELHDRIARGRQADLLLFSGGVSMGEYDLVEEVLASFHAEFLFTGVRMQPGKPVVFGRLPATADAAECFFFGLPGNPVSTQVTFHCFAEIFLRAISGELNPEPRWAQATLAQPVEARPNLTRLLPCRLHNITATLVPWQGSGDLAANARANCYAELLPNRTYAPGDIIRILLR